MKQLCNEAMFGKLNLKSVKKMKPLNNSYLFNCAVSAVVSFPDEKSISVQRRNEKKLNIADFFISQDIDINYQDDSESSLLISVVASYLPSEWKLKFTKILISKGCDIKKKNKYGMSALDLALSSKESEIAKILIAHDS